MMDLKKFVTYSIDISVYILIWYLKHVLRVLLINPLRFLPSSLLHRINLFQ